MATGDLPDGIKISLISTFPPLSRELGPEFGTEFGPEVGPECAEGISKGYIGRGRAVEWGSIGLEEEGADDEG